MLVVILLGLLNSCNSRGPGCTDTLANNTSPSATENDGSCTYDPEWIRPTWSLELDELISGSSGLMFWDDLLWTHNDNSDTKLYGLDSITGESKSEYFLSGVVNTNWEDIAEEGEYIYLGDFGNNSSGNRTDLHILRIEKNSLKSGQQDIDTIWFSYSDQQDLSPTEPNQTEFDCEALVVSSTNIYLFTKQWITGHTTIYTLPKLPGNHVAQKKASFNIQGLVTGASFLESESLLILCGYTGILQPFLFLLYDFPGHDFFSGNKRRLNISLPFLQVEGIATVDGLTYYLSSESFELESGTISPQQLHQLELNQYLEAYLKP